MTAQAVASGNGLDTYSVSAAIGQPKRAVYASQVGPDTRNSANYYP
ncbi:hypothetical protein ACVI1I_006723 [Bradyrhizobium sp. USDA 4459]